MTVLIIGAILGFVLGIVTVLIVCGTGGDN